MDELFNQFLEEKRYLDGVSKKTLVWYTYSFKQYNKHGEGLPTKQTLNQFVIGMRKSGLSTAAINDYIRGCQRKIEMSPFAQSRDVTFT